MLVPTATLRETFGLDTILLINKSRLSVQPVTEEEFRLVRERAR